MPVYRDKRTKGWRWRTKIRLPNGKKVRLSGTPQLNTKEAAHEDERAAIQRALSLAPERKEAPNFKKFAEEFMETYAKANNKPSEQKAKRYVLDSHLLPAFEKRALDEIGPREIEQLKAKLLKDEYSPKTINNVVAVLSKILRFAEELELIDAVPRLKLLHVPPQKFEFLDDDEYDRLREAARREPDTYAAICAAGDAGLRRGEILGLLWEDVDLRSGRLTVRRSMWNGELMAPKGRKERTVPLTDRLAKALAAIRHLRGKHVFCRMDGSAWTWEVMRAALPRCCKRAGLRVIGWHALRHTFCSHLAMRGAPAKAIQELAGHASLGTTLRYMHLTPGLLDETINLLEAGPISWQQRANRKNEAAEIS